MHELKFALFGAGFWARYQLAGWQELPGVSCVAICDSNRAKAEALAQGRHVPAVYTDPEMLLQQERPDFVDIVTPVETHPSLVHLAAKHRIPAICQKPMAATLQEAQQMLEACRAADMPLFIHENWRWQTPLRAVKRLLDEGSIGRPFRARIDMISGFPVFANQPALKTLEQFILTDLGTHILDVARFLFGEAETVTCQTHRIHRDIAGEDVATVLLGMPDCTIICEMAYAGTYLEKEAFPETFVFIEGERGSIELDKDCWVRVTTEDGTHARRYPPPQYPWVDPAYALVQTSIVPCLANLLGALRGKNEAETTGADNLQTMKLVFASYDSAARKEVIHL